MNRALRVTVIVPSYNGGEQLARTIAHLQASSPPVSEIIVVDDGSSASTADALSRISGVRVIYLEGPPKGPAYARNRGAEAANVSDYLCFVDADVLVETDAICQLVNCLVSEPCYAAAFGSYDDSSAHKGVVSIYKNLLHHYTHQVSKRDAGTFWCGLGVVSSNAFWELNGFDESFKHPSVEDIEFGMRLRRHSYRIALVNTAQGRHLKQWNLRSMVVTDFARRGFPWSVLLQSAHELPNDLNLRYRERFTGVVGIAILAAILTSGWIGAAPVVLLLALFVLLQQDFLRVIYSHVGPWRMASAIALHWLYFLIATVSYACARSLSLVMDDLSLERLSRR